MAIVYRLVKGSPLTKAEYDGNLAFLDGKIDDVIDNPQEPRGIESISGDTNELTFVMTDSTEEVVTIDLSAVNFNPTGNWAPSFPYQVLDIFLAPDGQTYVVRYQHVSGGSGQHNRRLVQPLQSPVIQYQQPDRQVLPVPGKSLPQRVPLIQRHPGQRFIGCQRKSVLREHAHNKIYALRPEVAYVGQILPAALNQVANSCDVLAP